MGRGRAKAKQVKVARQLKYNSGGTDLDRLRTELGVGRADPVGQARTLACRDCPFGPPGYPCPPVTWYV